MARTFLLCSLLILYVAPVAAQNTTPLHPADLETSAEGKAAYERERDLIEASLETVVTVLQEATLAEGTGSLSDRLGQISARLAQATKLMGTTGRPEPHLHDDDLGELRRLVRQVLADLEALRVELEAEGHTTVAQRLRPLEQDLAQAQRLASRVPETVPADDGAEPRSLDTWTAEDRKDDRRSDRRACRYCDDRSGRRAPFTTHRYRGAFVGEMWGYRWPFRGQTALYRPIPAIRYNRVEGLVLGIGRQPAGWDDYARGYVYGQGGYAFALEEWRYEIGVETRLDRGTRDTYGLKVGVAYRENTTTDDLWKTSWLENSLAAFFFENDFFDYYETEGWNVYAIQRVSPFLQVSGGYRAEEHRALTRNTGWSLFDGGGFQANPFFSEGRMQSLVFALEGGRVQDLHELPRGAAFRLEAEVGSGLGGDFDFNRYIADGRLYVPLPPSSSLALRLRGGVVEGDLVPFQKQFTLGGIGTMRGYDQNRFLGTRMLLGNAEYIVDDLSLLDDLIDDFLLIGFVDAGWTNGLDERDLDLDDIYPSAGFGIGLDDRDVRLEVAWPLRDAGTGLGPSLWLRITPSF